MKQSHTLRMMLMVLLLPATTGATIARADIIYQETFDNTGSSAARPSSVNWNVHVNVTGARLDDATFAAIINAGGDPSAGAETGFLRVSFGIPGSTSGRTLMWTDQVNVSVADITTISWFQGNQKKSDRYKLAVREGGVWKVTDALMPPQDNDVPVLEKFASDGSPISVMFSSLGSWSLLNFNGTPVSSSTKGLFIGGPTTAPSGTIDAIGLFIDTPDGFRAIDTFTVNAVPEPSSFLLTFIGGVGLVCYRRYARRRKKQQSPRS